MGRREHQGAAIAFGVQHGGHADADDGFAAAHFAIDDGRALEAIEQQLGDGVRHFGLGGEQLAFETGEDDLAMRPRLSGIDRRIGAVQGIEQTVAELGDEVLQAEGERRGSRIGGRIVRCGGFVRDVCIDDTG